MNKKDIKYYIASFMIHVLALSIAITATNHGTGYGSGGKKRGRGNDNRRIKPNTVAVDIVEQKKEKLSVKDKNATKTENAVPVTPKAEYFKPNGDPCKEWFGGIGIYFDTPTNKVLEVPIGYPASQAGILPGDLIIEIDGGEILGEVGTVVRFMVNRNGTIIPFTITRGVICY